MMKALRTQKRTVSKTIAVLLMFFCLAFLTGINFILYPSADNIVAVADDIADSNSDDNSSSGPVEEKNVSSGSFVEEFLHEHFYLDVSVINNLLLHKIHEAEKLQIVHFEILSPPPDPIS